MPQPVEVHSLLSEFDVFLFKSGRHYKLYEKFGSHEILINGVKGVYFAVWAPNAQTVSVVGNFNGWNPHSHQLHVRWDSSGIWEGFIPGLENGEVYKYHIHSNTGEHLEKSDPFALHAEIPPKTASIVATTWYDWSDSEWMFNRREHNALDRPMSVYEMHLGSWLRDPKDPDRFLSYTEIAEQLIPYIQETEFTHVEFKPIRVHPY